MKYLPLVWAGIWRKRSRAVLMLLQVASAFVLFGVLQGFNAGVARTIAMQHGDILIVGSRVALGNALPIGMLPKIRSVPGVELVSPRAGFGGTYQKPNQHVGCVAIDANTFFKINQDEVKPSPGAVAALQKDRTGAVAGIDTMRKYGWKIGEHVVLVSGQPRLGGSRDWGFDIVGTFDVQRGRGNSATGLIVNFAYLNDSRATKRDTANMYSAKIDSAAHAGAISLAIDNLFANSPNETHTQSEAELAAAQVQQVGDLQFIVHGVIGAVFFALLLATGALMMQSIRERIPELAVMKTIGFTDRRMLALLLCESVAFCIVAAAIGLAIGSAVLPLARKEIGIATVPGLVFAEGIGCAIVLAVIAAWIPARRGARLQVVDALAGR
ncbi:MAG: ABC transporter permease [Steroidobacteraceae bacterium]